LLSRCALDRNELGADEMREDDEGLDADAVLGGWREGVARAFEERCVNLQGLMRYAMRM
jgi:hypothetical protein